MLNRWVEDGLLDVLGEKGVGMIAFSPLAQGMLTEKYLNGIPEGSRATKDTTLLDKFLNEENLGNISALNEIAKKRNQSLAQMAIAWVLRDKRVVSVVMGASKINHIEENVKTLNNLDFSKSELEEINKCAKEGDLNLWAKSSNYG